MTTKTKKVTASKETDLKRKMKLKKKKKVPHDKELDKKMRKEIDMLSKFFK